MNARHIAFVLGAVFIGLSCGQTDCQSREPEWQTSQDVDVVLSIRDRYGDLGRYTALFILTRTSAGSGQSKWQKSKDVNGTDYVSVNFPSDFGTSISSGHYRWECLVSGKARVHGEIDYDQSSDRSTKVYVPFPKFGPATDDGKSGAGTASKPSLHNGTTKKTK